MPTTEQDLRTAFARHPPPDVTLDPAGLVLTGHRRLQRRRFRRVGVALVVPTLLVGGVLADRHATRYELAGSGLTLAAGTDGPVQVSDDRVDLGDGIQAWREGKILSIGYPARPNAFLDTSSLNSQWGDLGYDVVVFDDPGQNDGSTIVVVGSVQGAPTSVRVGIDGVFVPATIACFEQAKGWCSYKANVPVSISSYDADDMPQVEVS